MDKELPWWEGSDEAKLLADVAESDGKVDLSKEQLTELLRKFWWLGKEN